MTLDKSVASRRYVKCPAVEGFEWRAVDFHSFRRIERANECPRSCQSSFDARQWTGCLFFSSEKFLFVEQLAFRASNFRSIIVYVACDEYATMRSHRVGGAGCIINLRCLSRVVSFRHVVMTFFFWTNSRPHLRCAECESLAAFRAGIFKLPADCVDRVLPLSPVEEKTILIQSVGRHFLGNRCPFKGASVCYFCYFDAEVDRRDGRIIGRGWFRSHPECGWTVCQSVIQ